MFRLVKSVFICLTILLLIIETCSSDPQPPFLALYSPGDTEYIDIIVRQEHDNLTLVCEVRGDTTPRVYVWNYVNDNGTDRGRPFSIEPAGGASVSSKLERTNLQLSDSGHYMCSAPPFSITLYILVQPRGPAYCARGAFWCGPRCVLPAYVCDGWRDCPQAEDEAPPFCPPQPCSRNDKLNCSSGRCISESACCRAGSALCREPACCAEHRYSTLAGYVEVEFPPLFEDRHAPDDYGFIQSTIYTVTACALIFMIAVVLLVSALCKMHMKRAALRGYAAAHRDTAHHYAARYPPRYEAATARLLEPGASASPVRSPQVTSEAGSPTSPQSPIEATDDPACNGGFGLARLSAIFCSRYRQVPTQCCDVEMTNVRSASLTNSPTNRTRTLDYRSPTYCDTDMYFTNPDLTARELNYMATPIEFLRRRTFRRNTIDRVMDQLSVQRPLTLQLGRFQLSIPRFGRRAEEPRPDTPNVAEINIDDLEFVRLHSRETYTLNGRTIRLLGANFENYPVMDSSRPPPYNEAMRYKYGPPPEYLSREGINGQGQSDCTENEARSNVEMPPCYEDLASGIDSNANIDNLTVDVIDISDNSNNNITSVDIVDNTNVDNNFNSDNDNNMFVETVNSVNPVNSSNLINDSSVPETISSVIDNLPAIDSDVNANDSYNGIA
ncbi:uncharacterized protein LOC125074992 [Vanessa atalanta]|uniref:uncharacterized protein LOC125074992 n=1 Tax=Vanessa atalanta TaxID=42275 RepID=UPI001FCDC4D2|nr:uncharacterized protein LOC125074992 [Vanessa atalanta]